VTLYSPNTTISNILLNHPHGALACINVEGNPRCRTSRERLITFLLSDAT